MSEPSTRGLDWWRGDRGRWVELSFTASPDESVTDLHAAARAAVLRELFSDSTDEDADFLVYLLAQETLMHQSGWSFSDSMGMAALLVAERKRLGDVFALWNAKNANFDTMFGLDSELLFAAGVEETIVFVEASDDPARDGIMRYVSGTSLPTDAEVAARLTGLRHYHTA
ncbi:hypothetical protein [Amycolatopsis sp. NPDC059657]|uniref:hypothetical protein n=1 Tax=Amycolatopsis sp. NPDC059657 TaxID=3346899 RepID=UPI00366DA266